MNISDPIADMLTRMRNAIMARHQTVDIPYSTIKENMLGILRNEGFIGAFEVTGHCKKMVLRVQLKYAANKEPVLSHLRRISRPGLRVYSGHNDLPRVRGGMGLLILSTPRGILTNKDARRDRVGGEVLCEIW
ncbi:MAG: 30S ribosomal protein S8 [Chloroflexota bacterium]